MCCGLVRLRWLAEVYPVQHVWRCVPRIFERRSERHPERRASHLLRCAAVGRGGRWRSFFSLPGSMKLAAIAPVAMSAFFFSLVRQWLSEEYRQMATRKNAGPGSSLLRGLLSGRVFCFDVVSLPRLRRRLDDRHADNSHHADKSSPIDVSDSALHRLEAARLPLLLRLHPARLSTRFTKRSSLPRRQTRTSLARVLP